MPRRMDAEGWYHHALALQQIRCFDEALDAYRRALDGGIARPEEVRINRGTIYASDLKDFAAAERELHVALKIRPDFVPALMNLANLAESLGQREKAVELYERILSRQPNDFEALARLADAQSIARLPDPLVARLEQAAGRRDVPLPHRAAVHFALGRILDARGSHDRAFEIYTRGNAAIRALAPHVRYLRKSHEAFVDGLINHRGAAPQEKTEQPARLVFVCGMFRSGSTLAERILASHPDVFAGGERDLLPALLGGARYGAPIGRDDLLARYWKETLAVSGGAKVVTEKRPDNFLLVGRIKELFPTAKIVNTVRHPFDTCLSVYFCRLDPAVSYATDLIDTAHYYRQYLRLMDHWKERYPGDILDFDYDAYVREPRAWTHRLLAFCGLEWNEACLAFHDAKAPVETASAWQVREKLYTHASGRWRNYAQPLAPLGAYLADLRSD